MDDAGETCKLCLKFIQGNGIIILYEKILKKLEFLQMDLDQSVEESNSLCKDCEEKIENVFEFKTRLINSIKLSGSEDNQQTIPSTSTGQTSVENTVCQLCKNTVDKLCVISLTKLLKDDSMMEVFQRHIQEVDIKNLEDHSMVCEVCQKYLAKFSALVSSWLIAIDCNEDDTKDDMDNIEMIDVKNEDLNDDEFSDSNTNSSCAFEVSDSNCASVTKKGKGKRKQSTSDAGGTVKKIKIENNEISDLSDSLSLNSKVVKKEDTEENEETEEIEELQLKNEEIDIKDEDGLSQDNTDYGATLKKNRTTKNQTIGEQVLVYKIYVCHECSYVTNRKKYLLSHLKTHNSLDVQVYTCNECSFFTKHKTSFQYHLLNHKSLEEVQVYRCSECSFVTKHKPNLQRHVLRKHNNFEDVQVYRCNRCSLVTKYKQNLQRHLLNHKSSGYVHI